MGSIGDRLGLDLGALFGEVGEAPPEHGLTSGNAEAVGEDGVPSTDNQEATEASVPGPAVSATEEAIMHLAEELTGRSSAEISLDASLAELDLVGLPLWALVAELERRSNQRFDDSLVRSWVTLGDVVRAPEKAPSAS